MKKVTTILAAILLMAVGAAAQKLSYQAVVRNSSNELVPNTALTVEVSILDAVGAVQYAETHSATTNQNGLLVLTIGDGTVTAGTTVADVNWNGAAIQSVVKNGGAVVATITSPVNAVPYALQAGSSAGSLSQVNADWEATSGVAEILHKPTIPTTVAELTDAGDYVTDAELASAGYLTSETDPTVPAWAKESVKPAYDYSEITNTPDLTPYLTAETDPTVNDGTLTITLPDGTSETFTANQAGNTTVAIPAPAAMTAEDLLSLVSGMTEEQKEALRDALGVTGGGSDPATFVCGTSKMVDADGNEYETVQIGTQCWTKTNLRSTKDRNGNLFINGMTAASGSYNEYVDSVVYIPTDAAWSENNSSVTYDEGTFGYYYNWPAAMLVCPAGWHLPSDAEWNTMEATVSGSDWQTSYETSTDWRGDHAGKLAGGDDWQPSSTANAPGNTTYSGWGTSGFSAVPAGYCDGSSFLYAGLWARFWSSTQRGGNYAWYRHLYYHYANVLRLDFAKYYGSSVRCLRDAEPGGEEPGGEEPTSFNCGTSKMVDADGNEYETVQIGTQCWTKTNLRSTKDRNGNLFINGMTAASGSYNEYVDSVVYIPTDAAWSENNSSVTYDEGTFGYYYNWPAAMLVCPAGWHLPSDAEWTQLETYVSNAQESTVYVYRCDQSDATSIAKALASKTDWKNGNGECYPGDQSVKPNNATGFSAVPAGGCVGSSFSFAGNVATFWSATQNASYPLSAYGRGLGYSTADVPRDSDSKDYGYSVRCLRD